MTSSSRDLPATELAVTLDWRGRAAVLAREPETLVVDLREVTFFCSAGLQVLAAAHRKLAERALRVVSDSAVTSGPLRTTGLDTWIGLHPTVDEALR